MDCGSTPSTRICSPSWPSNQRFVSGLVRVKLFKGKATVVGGKSEHSLYSKKLATYESGDQFDHDAAKGFIRLWGLGQQTQARQQLLKGGRGFDMPGLLTASQGAGDVSPRMGNMAQSDSGADAPGSP